jgi:hypothetical protein
MPYYVTEYPVANGYSYCEGKCGCDNTWDIIGPNDQVVAYVPFWDDGDGKTFAAYEPDAVRIAATLALLDMLRDLIAASDGAPRLFATRKLTETRRRAKDVVATIHSKLDIIIPSDEWI